MTKTLGFRITNHNFDSYSLDLRGPNLVQKHESISSDGFLGRV